MHRYRYFIVVFFLLGSVAACSEWKGDGNAVSDKVERMSIAMWAPMQSPKGDALIRSQVNAFNQSQRNIQVQLTLLEPKDYSGELLQARRDEALPEIVCLDTNQLKAFATDSLLQPLDKMMSQRLWNDLLPDLLELGHVDTHIYGIPAIHKPGVELLWSVLHNVENKAATMTFIQYLLHPDQQRSAVEAGYTQAVTYSANL